MWQVALTLFLSSVGIWVLFKYLLIIEMRIDANTFKTMYDMCSEDKKFMIQEEFISESRYPVTYVCLCFFKGAPWFYLNHGERLMQAGWQGKDHVTVVSCFRWRYGRLKEFLKVKLKESQLHAHGVPVQLMLPHYTDKIGSLKHQAPEPVVDGSLWRDFEEEVAECAAGGRDKTSALLYGPPGNGKTSLVKYLATKHRMPVMIMTFIPEWTNHDLLLLFSQIPKRCIVLLEDFDNYFDGRRCLMGNNLQTCKFTFDIVLNGLDGVYRTYENVVFIMTVNDINKVDPALRNRPSRFKYTRLFGDPDRAVRMKILGDDTWSDLSGGLNLDQVFRMKEYKDRGDGPAAALARLEREAAEGEVRRLAYRLFEDRTAACLPGDHEGDWSKAMEFVADGAQVK